LEEVSSGDEEIRGGQQFSSLSPSPSQFLDRGVTGGLGGVRPEVKPEPLPLPVEALVEAGPQRVGSLRMALQVGIPPSLGVIEVERSTGGE
jgi:hypothetical protein